MIQNNESRLIENNPISEEAADCNVLEHSPLDVSVLQAMAVEYFPEIFMGQDFASELVSQFPLMDLSDTIKKNFDDEQEISLNQPVNKRNKSEDDFIQAISAVSIFDIMNEQDYPDESTPDSNASSYQIDTVKSKTSETCPNFLMADGIYWGDSSKLFFSPDVVPELKSSGNVFDVNTIRKDFPILSEKVHGKNLVWLDNAATTQKPTSVIERLKYFYEHENSNVHRGAHALAMRTTNAFEDARAKIATFLGAANPNEIVFVRGTTEAINLVAQTYGVKNLSKGDEIIISWLEHHANIVPWQMVCAKTNAKLKVIPVDESGQIILSEYEKLLSPKTKIVAVTHVSNALGTITPLYEIVNMAHRYGAKVLVDGAQAVGHLKVDVQALDCDFYAFSGHKLFAPTGIGALYGKADILNTMPPYHGGGNMISDVTFERSVYQDPPHRFEAGTGSIADAIGLGTAIDYVTKLGMDRIYRYEHQLLEYATELLQKIPGLTLIGTAKQKTSLLSFVLKGHKTEEVGKALSSEGIAVRAGHHCAQPILRRYGLESTVRPSLAFYNTKEEVDFLTSVIRKLVNGHAPK